MIDTTAIIERNDLFISTPKAHRVTRRYCYLRLRVAASQQILPGQFAMLKAHGIYEPLLRRAMAYYRVEPHSDSSTSIEFIYQILGRGTDAISTLRVGGKVDCLGPLGNTYEVKAVAGKEALLVVGGVGSAAVFMLAEELKKQGTQTKLFIGGASRGDLLGLDDFIELLGSENIFCATIDGSEGESGFVTAPLERHLKNSAGSKVIYSCGPDAMLHVVGKIAAQYEIPAQLSLEAPMACGIGICVGCAVPIKHDCAEKFVYKKVCTDGPIFWSRELYW